MTLAKGLAGNKRIYALAKQETPGSRVFVPLGGRAVSPAGPADQGSIIRGDRLAAGARGQRGQDRVGVVAQKTHRTIGEQEERAPAVRAPEMKHVALAVQPARNEVVRARGTRAYRHP